MFDLAWWPELILLPLPLLIRLWRSRLWHSHPLEQNSPLAHSGFPLILDPQTTHKGTNKFKQLAIWLIWSLLVIGAARPQWVDDANTPIIEQGRDILIAVDLSSSMEISDMQWQNQTVDRLTAVRHLLAEFVQQRRGDRLGLILFADHAYLQSPLTFDTDTIAQYVLEMEHELVGNMTAIGEAMGMGIKQLLKLPNEQRVLVLLTDGQNTSGEVKPDEATKIAAESGVTIYTIGIGSNQMKQRTLFGTRVVNPSADLDETLLKDIANQTGGQYFRATNSDELAGIYQTLNQLNPITESESYFRPRQELYFWPLALACLLIFAHLLPLSEITTAITTIKLRRRGHD